MLQRKNNCCIKAVPWIELRTLGDGKHLLGFVQGQAGKDCNTQKKIACRFPPPVKYLICIRAVSYTHLDWAVHHLELFPVEINKADYYTLLRVPGIGTKSAKRILSARRHATLDFSDIKKMGVVLKRALYFITCKGKMMYQTRMEENYITRHLTYNEKPAEMFLSDGTTSGYEQFSLFDPQYHL